MTGQRLQADGRRDGVLLYAFESGGMDGINRAPVGTVALKQ